MYYLPKSLNLLLSFGKRSLSGKDFVTLCDANHIELILTRGTASGIYYYTPEGQHTIALSSRIHVAARRWVGWHEFAHFLQNFYDPRTTAAFCKIGEQTPAEKLADMFAMICTHPNTRLCRPLDYIAMIMRGEK